MKEGKPIFPTSESPYYNRLGAAAFLSVHPNTINRWLSNGVLQGQKIGSTWRFLEIDLIRAGRPKTSRIPEQIGGSLRPPYGPGSVGQNGQ